jgi:hypothetical protein
LAVSRCFSSSGAGQIESVVDDWMCLHKEYSAWVLALNETLCRLISTNTHLHELGEQYGHAQSVVSERDQQIAERDVTLLGRISRKILYWGRK